MISNRRLLACREKIAPTSIQDRANIPLGLSPTLMGTSVSTTITHDSEWDQRVSLQPPPFRGPLARILTGLTTGDPPFDELPASLCAFSHRSPSELTSAVDPPSPAWADWESVRRGQKVFASHLASLSVIGFLGLVHGFTIARFGEVLLHNGYAQSPITSFERYRETGFAVLDWMTYPLDDSEGRARKALRNVRAMHSAARRRSKRLFDPAKGEGIALSQYDMAIVHLGFAGVSLHLLENLILRRKNAFSAREKEDIVHAWRVVGYYLGISDEYNVCLNGYEELEVMVHEFLRFVPHHFATCRPSARELQRSALEGFGRYTGLGVEVFVGMLHAVIAQGGGENDDYLERKPLPGMRAAGLALLRMMGTFPFESAARFIGPGVRDGWRAHPSRAKWLVSHVLPTLSRANDLVVWRGMGLVAVVVSWAVSWG